MHVSLCFLRIRCVRVPRPARCSQVLSPGSIVLLFKFGHSFTYETVGKRFGGGISGASMFALYVDKAQRAAIRITQEQHGTSSAIGRIDGDFAIRHGINLKTTGRYGVHFPQQPFRIVESDLFWCREAFFFGFFDDVIQIAQSVGNWTGKSFAPCAINSPSNSQSSGERLGFG